MTGALTTAAAVEHANDLQRVATERRKGGERKRPRRRWPALPRLRRPRHALAN